MPRFQLEVGIALATAALVSAGVFYLNRPREGKIQLPTHAGYEEFEDEAHHGHDPFDVTKAEDVIDGFPIDGDAFWAKMRWRKLVMLLLLTVIVALNAASLGWSVANDESVDIVVYMVHLAFSLYLVTVAAYSVNKATIEGHSEYIRHLTALTTITILLLGATAILPDTPPVTASLDTNTDLRGVWLARLALYTIVCLLYFTTPQGPRLHFPPERIYSEKTIQAAANREEENVSGSIGASIYQLLLFSYTTKVVWLGNIATSLETADLPIVPASMRATFNYSKMKRGMRDIRLRIGNWSPKRGNGWEMGYRLVRLNLASITLMLSLAATSAVMFYTPALFLQQFVRYLEVDTERRDMGWGWVYVTGLFASNAITYLITGQLWSMSTTTIQVRLRVQLNSILFAKTLVRKDVASSAPPPASKRDTQATNNTTTPITTNTDGDANKEKKDEEDDFSSKAQIMTLMTTDVDRVSEFAWHLFSLVDSPIEIAIGSLFLYKLLGVSCFFGLGVTCLFLPLNHYAGKVVVGAQENLMKARDERVALMNEILGGIRMLKFMAWERNFEAKVLKVREKELKYQKLNYSIETLWNAIWNGSPILVTLVAFWHFAVVRQQVLTPSIAFTSIIVFNEMKFALNALPETFINLLQSLVSLRRIEKYMNAMEVAPVPPIAQQSQTVAFQSCSVTWPQDRAQKTATPSAAPSAASTPKHKFMLMDMNMNFPLGELSLICGKLGSGKTLLLLALLGEADVLTGQVLCPRSPPDSLASFAGELVPKAEWIVKGICAYVPQAAWLRNASIKDNILFNLPLDEERYQRTLEVCALISDLEILEDGDEAEIGERGVNLSGGQKARVSLARAVYSRASILLLDDVLSAVDAHTAHHLYHQCLKGDLMKGRTVILVSHHVQLCAPGASYVVALDNGRVMFEGDRDAFQSSGVIRTLVQTTDAAAAADSKEEEVVETMDAFPKETDPNSESSSTIAPVSDNKVEKKTPRKLIEEEKRAVGRIGRDVWATYILACGKGWYWTLFLTILIVASLSPVFENGWLRHWSSVGDTGSATFYIGVYAAITAVGLVITTLRWFVLYNGSIRASTVLYKRLLEAVLFANIRFHDTVSRGRLLNRFGKDFEGIDSSLSDNFGRSIIYALSALTTIVTVSVVGGPLFIFAACILGIIYWNAAKVYGQTSRDMRRLDSVTRSPLYSLYGETIAGVTILRAFGASSKFLRDMLCCVDTNSNPYYWMWGVNRWLSMRFNLLSCGVIGATALVCLITPSINASLAGFALTFASTITGDLLFMVRRFVGLEQSMVALERVKEYSELKREPPEFVEPRPPATWPSEGAIECQNLVIRYAPELPNVLHNLSFTIHPGEKVGILGRTGSGKSTLALSFFRFVEATEGRILVDAVDIAKVGLTDLRSRLTIIPQEPTILSGTLRSTLDVFDEYEDAEIYEALRRVHLIPSEETPEEAFHSVNENVFRNLDSPVSEGGENFSTGEKQLLCMARAILKRSRVLVMDEATASVDYATDELIGKTIRREFAHSTILTIAHRLRTIIDYDRVMLLDQGRIAEFDRPSVLLQDPSSKFHALCKATGREEFAMLKKMAGV
ncbi:putative atp-binding cassette transporter [Lyophyllum shimeji]|uniref:Atp-binding cassette transporter n=1 Tax=Lyophyllum shimeji TaxID=47721 RepID=A0A9P3PVQ6_LYOSH|nr:putative atp-binding cassette transporter [Lyophyllum shimeji]